MVDRFKNKFRTITVVTVTMWRKFMYFLYKNNINETTNKQSMKQTIS
ncbi:MAG: hypothetical protein WCS11_07160 [Dysgonamonadaceae bacterium]|nr:hypothetical protein [Dysgonamonadaceae bacterium]MDD3727669.1 hypothetical protein [Dysgonamonadaceae bacterium]